MALKVAVLLLVAAAVASAGVPHLRPQAQALLDMPRDAAVAHLKQLLRPMMEAALDSAEVTVPRGIIDDQIIKILEQVRTLLREGNEEMGIPVLDPFNLSHLDVETHQTLLDFTGGLDEFVIEGLSGYNIDKIKWSTILLTFNFGLTFPKIDVYGKYNADAVVGGLLPIFGDGPFDFLVENFVVSGKAKLGIKGLGFQIKSCDINLDFGSYHSNIDGLLGGGDLSALINEVINDLVPEVWVARKAQIESLVGEAVVVVGNKVLDSILYKDALEYLESLESQESEE